ncbi:MAG: phosphoglycerate dehydrogenase [Thermodesulfobacteriota bacterium]
MAFKVLVSAPYMQPVPEKYRAILEDNGVEIIVHTVEERMNEDDLLSIISDIDGVISGDDEFTERVFKEAKKLKVISKWGTGIDSINQSAAKVHGVAIRNTPGAFTVPVADSVLGYILSFARKLPWMNEHMHDGNWEKIPGMSLSEATLGIIGVGDIGKAVATRASTFGMRLLGCDIVDMPEDFLSLTGIKMVSKEELLKESDFVSLSSDLNPSSHHIMSVEEFKLMKKTAILLNLARGPLVDEPTLVAALQAGEIAGAALDVFENEPLPKRSPLREFSNVMLAPHNSNSSPGAWERVHESTVKHLLEELDKAKETK